MQFLLGFGAGMERLDQVAAVEDARIERAVVWVVGGGDQRNQVMEVLRPFAGTEVDAEAGTIDLGVVSQAGRLSRACCAAAAANWLLTARHAASVGIL